MCPFIDKAYARCAAQMTFRNLSHAFAHCADRYAACPVYQRFIAEKCTHDQVQSASRVLAAS